MRRTLAGWPDDLEFAVYVASEAGPFRSPAPPYGSRPNVPANNVMVHRRDTLRTWIAQGAVVRIDEPVIERRCDGLRDSLSIVPTDTVTCHIGLYQVAVRSELLARPHHDSRSASRPCAGASAGDCATADAGGAIHHGVLRGTR